MRPAQSHLRVRYDRLGTLTAAGLITAVACLAGVGAIPTGGPAVAEGAPAGRLALDSAVAQSWRGVANAKPADVSRGTSSADSPRTSVGEGTQLSGVGGTYPGPPAESGTGRRVVYDISGQRVWMVTASGRIADSYLVSGGVGDNLGPGTYAVTSRQRHAVGIDDSGTMEYFVVFTAGQRAAIGFHSIPVKDGKLLQSRSQLGTRTSHGCIRQALPDAKRMWDFADIGTKVVVTA